MTDLSWARTEDLHKWKHENDQAIWQSHRMVKTCEEDNRNIVAEILRRDNEPTTD